MDQLPIPLQPLHSPDVCTEMNAQHLICLTIARPHVGVRRLQEQAFHLLCKKYTNPVWKETAPGPSAAS